MRLRWRLLLAVLEFLFLCCWLPAPSWGSRRPTCGFTSQPLVAFTGLSSSRQPQPFSGLGGADPVSGTPTVSTNTRFIRGAMLRSFTRLASVKGPVQMVMERKLQETLAPTFMEVVNMSAAHKGHPGNPSPHLDETHFTLRIRSPKFQGKSLVQQHRLIYEVLKQELQGGVHALSIQSGEPSPEDTPNS